MKYSILSLILTLLFLGHGDLLAANDFRERIYVQTDKQVYLAGELLWLKLCVTDATGIPVSFSKVGYVELLDESTALVQVKIEIKEGIGEGWLELPALLPTGYYRLVAYTRYMRNEGDTVFSGNDRRGEYLPERRDYSHRHPYKSYFSGYIR